MMDDGDFSGDENTEDYGDWMSLCCMKCKSKNIEIKKSKEGYFWISLCYNCGYKGKEGDAVGCLKKNPVVESEYD